MHSNREESYLCQTHVRSTIRFTSPFLHYSYLFEPIPLSNPNSQQPGLGHSNNPLGIPLLLNPSPP